jgi:hypothetical protein
VAPAEGGFDSGGGRFVASLRSDSGDVDLYLEKFGRGGLLGLATVWRIVAASEHDGGNEDVVFDGGPGRYRWRITAPEGAAKYEFSYNRP